MPKIYLYAEVLTHLRQLILHASLQTEKNEETKIHISSDKQTITVTHDGESSSLYLPTQISGTAKVTFPTDKKTELSARVQIDDLEQWKDADAAGIEAPWNASELCSETSMDCVTCGLELVRPDSIKSWKDLPNQNWADVMDLWFCHKPHEHHDGHHETKAAESKGFSAQSRLVSEPGVGLIDIISFALHPDDCETAKIIRAKNENTLKPNPVYCSQCNVYLGVFSTHDNLVRLDKSSLSVRKTRESPLVSYSPSIFVAAQLLELIESTAVRKVIAYSQTVELPTTSEEAAETSRTESQPASTTAAEDEAVLFPSTNENIKHQTSTRSENITQDQPANTEPEPQPLLLWIFNPDIYYSSSHLTTESMTKTETNGQTSPKNTDTDTTTTTTRDKDASSTPTDHDDTPNKDRNASAAEAAASNSSSDPTVHPTLTPAPSTPNSTSTLHPHRALKIFYHPLPPSTLTSYLSNTPTPQNQSQPPNHSQYEPLPLPSPTLLSLTKTLKESTHLLPPNARNFQNYSIGLLDRFERVETGRRGMGLNPLARQIASGSGREGGKGLGMDGRARVTRWELPLGARGLFE